MPSIASQVLGFIGYVEFILPGGTDIVAGSRIVRATSCDVKATQNIEPGNVVDAHIDKTTYSLGPIEVGGTIAFPAVYEDGSDVTTSLWALCLNRGVNGELTPISQINIKYADQAAYAYLGDIIDTFEFTVTQSDFVNISVGIIGISRDDSFVIKQPGSTGFFGLRNSRIVTWNDAVVDFMGVGLQSNEVRSFSATVNNNSQRFFSLNGQLTAQIVAPTKRDITGSISIMGRNQTLATLAYSNKNRCTEQNQVKFGYQVGVGVTGTGCNGSFLVQLPGIVYHIEEIAITNELLETTVAYRSLPGIAYNGSGNNVNFLV